MNKNNERSSRAEQTAEWNLKSPQLTQPSHPLWWIAILLLINMIVWSWGLSVFAVMVLILSMGITLHRLQSYRRYQRQQWIEHYQFADGLWQHVTPSFSAKQKRLIERGLKDFFLIYSITNQKIAMPSQAVDALWHAFILDSKAYQDVCHHAFGKMLHHTPSYRMLEQGADEAPLFLVWQGACQLAGLYPSQTSRLPRLFAIDEWLSGVTGAYDAKVLAERYRRWRASASGGDSDASGSDSDSGGCGGGCGGD